MQLSEICDYVKEKITASKRSDRGVFDMFCFTENERKKEVTLFCFTVFVTACIWLAG